MKRRISIFLCLLLVALLAVPALAAGEAPVITMQPQSPNYPQYSVAMYIVKVDGTNLQATWYMEWLGKTYNISKLGGTMQDWEPYAGEAYGARQLDANTFAFIFEGIETDLDGAYIWCVIEDGHYDVTCQKTRISVGNENSPPVIVDIPAQLTVEQGEEAVIRCVATAPEGTQLSYLWYESDTGRIEDIRAVNRGTETADYLICDTSAVGTRNYICFINTSDGGFACSSFVPVTVTEKTQTVEPPRIQTEQLPQATVGAAYEAKLSCSDPDAAFFVYYNPGKANDFEKTGLTLASSGQLSGIPQTAGSYSFCICAAGLGGEDYKVYTLTVQPPEASTPTQPQTTAPSESQTPATTPVLSATQTPAVTPTEPRDEGSDNAITGMLASVQQKIEELFSGDLSWVVLVLVGVAAAGAGVVAAILLTKKKR